MYAAEQQIRPRGASLGADATVTLAKRAETELASLFNRCTDSLCRLESTVSALSDRLNPVIRPVPVAGQKETGEGGPLSPLGGEVAMVTNRIDMLQHQLYSLLEALAV
jgi:HPt (histidine-containing phosphotransfer) domain-containing protein